MYKIRAIEVINLLICAVVFGALVGLSLRSVTQYSSKQVKAGIIKTINLKR